MFEIGRGLGMKHGETKSKCEMQRPIGKRGKLTKRKKSSEAKPEAITKLKRKRERRKTVAFFG